MNIEPRIGQNASVDSLRHKASIPPTTAISSTRYVQGHRQMAQGDQSAAEADKPAGHRPAQQNTADASDSRQKKARRKRGGSQAWTTKPPAARHITAKKGRFGSNLNKWMVSRIKASCTTTARKRGSVGERLASVAGGEGRQPADAGRSPSNRPALGETDCAASCCGHPLTWSFLAVCSAR